MNPELLEFKEQLAALIVDTAASLCAGLQELEAHLQATMRQDPLNEPEDIARMMEYSERVDELPRTRDREIAGQERQCESIARHPPAL